MTKKVPLVSVIMGSTSDWDTMKNAADILDNLQIPYEKKVISAHRTPHRMYQYAADLAKTQVKVVIAGAGGAAHLPGMVASLTNLPVLGVPVKSKSLKGLDSLLSIVQMPAGIPVATFAIGEAGAKNSALYAASIIGLEDSEIANNLATYRKKQSDAVPLEPF